MAKDQQTPEQPEDYKGILGDYDESAQPEQSEDPAPPKKNNTLKIAGIGAASVALLMCLGFVDIWKKSESQQDPPVTSEETQITQEENQENQETQNMNTTTDSSIALSTENIVISPAVMECFYRDYLSQYGSALSYYDVDASASLKDQMLPEDAGESMSWFDYFMTQTQVSASQVLVINEAAKAAGHTLTEEENKVIDEDLASRDLSGYSESVTKDDLRKMIEMRAIASSYFENVLNNLNITDADCEEYYQKNKNSFDTCGLIGFTISYDDPDATAPTDEDGETLPTEEPGMTQEQAKAFADALENATSAEDFKNQICDILREYEGYTEEQIANIDPSISTDSFPYSEGNELAEWAFSANVNDKKMIEGTNNYSVYYLTRAASRDDTETVNVRHILFSISNHTEELAEDADEDAVAAAEEKALAECWKLAQDTLAQWEAGEKTEDSFAELASQLTEDPGSQTTGGLYENVYVGQMVTAFNDWCFDASRQPGDTGLVETNYGVHVMYFSGSGDPVWKSSAHQALQSERMNAWYDEQEALWTITVNEEAISNIPG